MKKIFIILILLFLCITVKAEEVDVKVEWIPNVYYNYEKNGVNYWGQMGYIHVGDKIGYCLELENSITSNKYYSTNEYIENYSLVVLAAYFGYGYNNEITLKDYITTQKLIWQYLGNEVYFTTESMGKGSKINVFDYSTKIISRINRYGLFPRFNDSLNLEINEKKYFKDSNDVIGKLKVINSNNDNIYIEDDNLVIIGNEVGNKKFKLETQYVKNYPNMIYTSNDSQKLIIVGEVSDLSNTYDYSVKGGSISIDIERDIELNTKNINTFKLYKDDILINTYEVKDSLLIQNLEFGDYILKYEKVRDGYETIEDELLFELYENNSNIHKIINLSAKKAKIEIGKFYGNNKLKFIKPDNGVKYVVYDGNDNLISELETDEFGYCFVDLYYDNYKIVQENTSNVDIKHDDFIISKNDFENKIFNIYDEFYTVNIKLIGISEDNNIDFKFKYNDNDYDTVNDSVIHGLKEGIYKITNLESNGYNSIDEINIELNQDLEYYLFDNEIYYDYYIMFDKKIEEEPNLVIEGKNEVLDVDNNNALDLVDEITDEEKIEQENVKEISQQVNETGKKIDIEDNLLKNKNNKLPYLGVNYAKNRALFINFNSITLIRLY